MTEESLYQDVLNRGIPHDNHYSDLYIPVTDETKALIKKHDIHATTFVNQVEGGLWFDCAFQFTPYWESKLSR